MAKKQERKGWKVALIVIAVLFVIVYIFSGFISIIVGADDLKSGNVAIIPITGLISTGSSSDIFSEGIVSSGKIVDTIEEVNSNPNVKAIIIEIDSPGGAPVATDEIASAIKRSNKTTVAWIREVAASGGYWVASACDHVIANRMSITGSIGVYGSYLDFSGIMDDYNISYQKLVGGKYKDTGVPYRKLTADEERMLQKKIDLLHQEFKDGVQKNRNLTISQINALSEGEFYLGKEAIDLGLIDELGGKKEAIDYIEKKLQITAVIDVYASKPGLFDLLAGMVNEKSYFFGKGVGEGLTAKRSVFATY